MFFSSTWSQISLPEHSLNCTCLTASYMMLSSTQMNMGITGLPQTFKNGTIGEIYIFFSIILYMGVVQLPSKEDYWKGGTIWPSHTPCQQMKEYLFHQIWRGTGGGGFSPCCIEERDGIDREGMVFVLT